MGVTLISMIWLGLRRSFGHDVGVLRSAGVYSLTRNPQAVAFMIGIVGYVILWPTWQGAVSVLILGVMLHMMIMTEEEYLRTAYGDEYDSYCKRVPRYLGPLRRKM
jgi:protein-S-isoprenylcysteine O-methyltransferase Ste14